MKDKIIRVKNRFNKDKPLLNEIQVSLIYLVEQIERASFFEEITKQEYGIIKTMSESFAESLNNYINDIKGIKIK